MLDERWCTTDPSAIDGEPSRRKRVNAKRLDEQQYPGPKKRPGRANVRDRPQLSSAAIGKFM